MKIVTIEGGRILDLISTEELRPARGLYLPEFIGAIVSRYGFTSVPTDLIEAAKSGAKFEMGKFTIEGDVVAIKELAIYSDGLICDAYGTDTADLILDDVLEWATDTRSH
jgi:hypothetical protein